MPCRVVLRQATRLACHARCARLPAASILSRGRWWVPAPAHVRGEFWCWTPSVLPSGGWTATNAASSSTCQRTCMVQRSPAQSVRWVLSPLLAFNGQRQYRAWPYMTINMFIDCYLKDSGHCMILVIVHLGIGISAGAEMLRKAVCSSGECIPCVMHQVVGMGEGGNHYDNQFMYLLDVQTSLIRYERARCHPDNIRPKRTKLMVGNYWDPIHGWCLVCRSAGFT